MNRVAYLGVPSSAGARLTGQERAPRALRRAGFIERLRSAGLDVSDFGDLPEVVFHPDTEHPKQQNLTLVCDVIRVVTGQVAAAVERGMKPLVIGGDCTITLGVLAGMAATFPDLGLIYFDGDVDLNTPEVTPSGIFDGMVMAHIIGEGADELTRIGLRYPLMPEENIVLFGYNPSGGGMDAPESMRLEQSDMVKYPVTDIQGRIQKAAEEALPQLEEKADTFLLHFDVDVIDAHDFPAVDVPHEHGLRFDDAMEGLHVFISHSRFGGLVITEFNAGRDEGGACAERLVDGVVEALSSGHGSW
jgi:arginase